MKPSDFFALLFLLESGTAFSQAKAVFKSPTNGVPAALFNPTKSDPIVANNNVDLLEKTHQLNSPEFKITSLLKKYNWSVDLRNRESIKKMAMDIRKQDINGLDMPRDIHDEVIQQLYYENVPEKN